MKKRSLLPTVLCAAVSLVFLTGCGNNPKAVTEKWMMAIARGDRDTAVRQVVGKDAKAKTRELIRRVKETRRASRLDKDDDAAWVVSSFEAPCVGRPEIHGDLATVEILIGEDLREIKLRKVNGKWKIRLSGDKSAKWAPDNYLP